MRNYKKKLAELILVIKISIKKLINLINYIGKFNTCLEELILTHNEKEGK